MKKSTIPELRAMRSLTQSIERKIEQLTKDGWLVHIIFDLDHVLVDGRSDDIFAMLGNNLENYYLYEERMLLQPPYEGPWGQLARRCGKLHQTQDVITARSTFTTFRALLYIVVNDIPVRWLYGVGSAAKTESYRIALDNFKDKDKSFIFVVDDSERHISDFKRVAAELGMTERTEAILSPRIRLYSEEDLKAHYAAVMDPTQTKIFHVHEGSIPGEAGARYTFQVTPRGRKDFRDLLNGMVNEARKEAIVNSCRDELEAIAKRDEPNEPLTVDRLYDIWLLLRPS